VWKATRTGLQFPLASISQVKPLKTAQTDNETGNTSADVQESPRKFTHITPTISLASARSCRQGGNSTELQYYRRRASRVDSGFRYSCCSSICRWRARLIFRRQPRFVSIGISDDCSSFFFNQFQNFLITWMASEWVEGGVVLNPSKP